MPGGVADEVHGYPVFGGSSTTRSSMSLPSFFCVVSSALRPPAPGLHRGLIAARTAALVREKGIRLS